VKGQIENLRSDVAATESKIEEKERQIATLRRRIGARTDIKKEIKEAEEGKEETIQVVRTLKILENAFGRYGVRLDVLSELLESMQFYSTAYLQELAGRPNYAMKIGVNDEKPGIDFFFVEDDFEKPFTLLSAGEKVLMTLSVRLALAEILRAQTNTGIDFLVLDEVAGNLDEIRRGFLVEVIQNVLKQHFNQVFIISHVELDGEMDERFYVSKENGVSKVTAR
jgi:DNA repair exonuclease SbcCD ATPase subunit